MSGFGHPRRHLRLTDSTNERARELAVAGAPSGTVVTADEQSAGRGRRGRAWTAPPGKALLCSAVLGPLDSSHRLLPLAVPLAVADAAEALAPVSCQVKWPNDVWVERRKLAGVLIEARPPEWAVIGVGLNLAIEPDEFPAQLRWPATSLGHGVTAEAAVTALCAGLERWVGAADGEVLAAFRRRDALRGHRVDWEGAGDAGSGAGTAEGVDDDGDLIVVIEAGARLALGAGEVRLRLNG
jgi:BirA family transcriptional regulator, biotin operon repressor / biotin---[acetyl-CoA-carboxylase] ligase